MIQTYHEDYRDYIHDWFELTYAQYLVMPRSLMEAMPTRWQYDMAKLLEEFDHTFDWRPPTGRYWVQLKDGNGRYVRDDFMEYRHPNYKAIEAARIKKP